MRPNQKRTPPHLRKSYTIVERDQRKPNEYQNSVMYYC